MIPRAHVGWLSGPVQASSGTREFLEKQRMERQAERERIGDHRPRCSRCEGLLFPRGQWMWCALCQTVAHGWTTDRELYEMGVDLDDIAPEAKV